MASMPYFNSEQRHYKKDTRFLLDLYTITYDNHESVDNICCLVSTFFLIIGMEPAEPRFFTISGMCTQHNRSRVRTFNKQQTKNRTRRVLYFCPWPKCQKLTGMMENGMTDIFVFFP